MAAADALASSISSTGSSKLLPFSATGRPSSKRIVTASGFDRDVVSPERDAHDRLDDRDARVEELEVLRLVRRAEDVRVGGVRLLGAHLVREARALAMYSDISLRPPSSSMNC